MGERPQGLVLFTRTQTSLETTENDGRCLKIYPDVGKHVLTHRCFRLYRLFHRHTDESTYMSCSRVVLVLVSRRVTINRTESLSARKASLSASANATRHFAQLFVVSCFPVNAAMLDVFLFEHLSFTGGPSCQSGCIS